MAAIFLTSLVTMAFIFIGRVNVLAPIVTINFMLTYSFIDYSYFSVAMTSHLQEKEKRDALVLGRTTRRSSTRRSSTSLIRADLPSYGSDGWSPPSKGTLLEFTRDMDQMFPPVANVDSGAEKTSRHRKASAKQKLIDSFGLDLNSRGSSEEREEGRSSAPLEEGARGRCGGGAEPQVTCPVDLPAAAQNHGAGDEMYLSDIHAGEGRSRLSQSHHHMMIQTEKLSCFDLFLLIFQVPERKRNSEPLASGTIPAMQSFVTTGWRSSGYIRACCCCCL